MPELALPAATERLSFSALVAADASFVLELVNEPGWLRHIGDRNIHDLDAAADYIRKGPTASYATNGFGLYRVSLVDSGEAIGLSGLIRRETLDYPDIGYAFLQRHGGRGYATEAGQAVLQLARALELKELLAITSLQNDASIRVLEKLGFAYRRTLDDPVHGSSKVFGWQS